MSLRIAARGKLKLGKKDSNVVGPCKKMTKPRKKSLVHFLPKVLFKK